MIYIVDTNIFLRTLIKDDEQVFADCVRFLELIKTNQIKAVVPGVVLSELVWVLKSFYKFSKPKIVKALQGIFQLSGLKIIDNYNYKKTFQFYENKNVKYIDCLIASLVKDKNYAVVSYDRDFDKLKIKKYEPGQLK